MFDQDWIDLLNKGLTTNLKDPTYRVRTWDSQVWQNIDEYQKFIFDSHVAEIAGELM